MVTPRLSSLYRKWGVIRPTHFGEFSAPTAKIIAGGIQTRYTDDKPPDIRRAYGNLYYGDDHQSQRQETPS